MPRQPSDHNYIDPFYIEDPLRPANNVGRNCFRVFQVIPRSMAAHIPRCVPR